MSLYPDTITSNGLPAYTVGGNVALQTFLRASLAFAIARFEGFYQPDSIARNNLNPGNLRPYGDQSYVMTSAGKFRQFSTEEDGWKALIHQINLNLKRGLTLYEFFLGKPGVYPGYAPLADNDPEVMKNYLESVSEITGIGLSLNLKYYFPDIVKDTAFYGLKWVPPDDF